MAAQQQDLTKTVIWFFKKTWAFLSACILWIERYAKNARAQFMWTTKTVTSVHNKVERNVSKPWLKNTLQIAFPVLMIFVGLFLIFLWAALRALVK